MTILPVTQLYLIHTLTSKQSKLLLDLMMIKLWQGNIHITEKTVTVS